MDNFDIELLLTEPLIKITTSRKGFTTYKGMIYVNEQDWEIHVEKPSNNTCLIKVTSDLKPFTEELKIIPSTGQNIITILQKIKEIIKKNTKKKQLENHTEIYRRVLYEYNEFTKFFINLKRCELSYDLTGIVIETKDEANRSHCLEIQINYDDSKSLFAIKKYDLPILKDRHKAFRESNSLAGLYDQFLGHLSSFQAFWNLMDSLDEDCYILDPSAPSRSDCHRRIVLGDNVSVILKIDPLRIGQSPELKFLGPEQFVDVFRTKVNENLANWGNSSDTYFEILLLLGLEQFPPKPQEVTTGDCLLKEDQDCSICFSYRLNEKLPEIVCKNKSCQYFYHVDCLYEWLVSLNSRQIFSEICGQCPNCENTISCPIPN